MSLILSGKLHSPDRVEKLPEPQAPSLRPLSVNNPKASTVLEDGGLYVLARSATVFNDTFLGDAVFRSPEWSESLILAPLKNFLEPNPCTFSVTDPVLTVRDLWRLVPLGALHVPLRGEAAPRTHPPADSVPHSCRLSRPTCCPFSAFCVTTRRELGWQGQTSV